MKNTPNKKTETLRVPKFNCENFLYVQYILPDIKGQFKIYSQETQRRDCYTIFYSKYFRFGCPLTWKQIIYAFEIIKTSKLLSLKRECSTRFLNTLFHKKVRYPIGPRFPPLNYFNFGRNFAEIFLKVVYFLGVVLRKGRKMIHRWPHVWTKFSY